MTDWQPVSAHPQYEVSRCGRVRRAGGDDIGQWKNDAGYFMVRLSRPRVMRRVHRLVAQAFVPNPKGLPVVNHIDHDRAHNDASNLEWCTQKQNLHHAKQAGRMQTDYWVGRRSPNARLSDEEVREMRSLCKSGGYSHQCLGAMFGISRGSVGRIISGQYYANV